MYKKNIMLFSENRYCGIFLLILPVEFSIQTDKYYKLQSPLNQSVSK